MNLRTSRTLSALMLMACAGALALAGCSGSSSPSASTPTPSAAAKTALQNVDCSTLTIDSDSAALPTVSGDAGKEPTLSWSQEGAPSNLTVKTLTAGDGATLGANDTVTVNYAGWTWNSDKTFDSSYANGQPATFSLNGVISGWRCGLAGHKVGDRLVMSIPSELAYGDNPGNGIPGGPLVFVVDIQSVQSEAEAMAATANATMEGEEALATRGITVTGDLGAPATISVNSGAAEPTQPEVIVLARGTGEAITQSSTVELYMAFTSWDGSNSASSWDLHQTTNVQMATAKDLAGLVGVPAGSRVVVLLPATTDSSTGSAVPSEAYVMDIVKVS